MKNLIRKIIKEEKEKFAKRGLPKTPNEAAKKTKEIEASDYADTLENHVDHYKKLSESARKLAAELSKVNEQKQAIRNKIKKAV